MYLALGVNLEGHKELLGMWLAENEGAKLWLAVLNELKSRDLEDILIACVDGLKGFPDILHLCRHIAKAETVDDIEALLPWNAKDQLTR